MEHLSRGVLLEDTKLLALSSSVAFVLEGYVGVQKAHDSSTIRVIVEDRTTIFYDQTLPHWKIIGFAYEKVRNQNILVWHFLVGYGSKKQYVWNPRNKREVPAPPLYGTKS